MSQAAPATPGKNVPAIKVDTVGYPLTWRKLAIFNVAPAGAVVKDETGKLALTIEASEIVSKGVDEASRDATWQVDFSRLQTPGRYYLEVGGQKSDTFAIGAGVYREALRAALKHFYFQRCRTKLEAPYATWQGDTFARSGPCHAHEDVGWDYADYPQRKRKWQLQAGWHDAGNYSQYVPSTAPSAQALLAAYERHPELFKDGDGNLPESGNKVPDILDEARYGLLWLLSMQEPDSGALRSREAVYDWDEGKAQDDRKVRWVAGIGTASTAKAASVLAVAARVYKKWDAAFAARCERASRAAWAFIEKHPEGAPIELVIDSLSAGAFTPTLRESRGGATATAVGDGTVVVVGGNTGPNVVAETAEVFADTKVPPQAAGFVQ